MTERLVLSVAEAAEALGVSDDLVYELTERGESPCVRFGRRKLIPRRAVELLVESAVAHFDPAAVVATLHGKGPAGEGADSDDPMPPGTGTVGAEIQPSATDHPSSRRIRSSRTRTPDGGKPIRDQGEGDAVPLRLFD